MYKNIILKFKSNFFFILLYFNHRKNKKFQNLKKLWILIEPFLWKKKKIKFSLVFDFILFIIYLYIVYFSNKKNNIYYTFITHIMTYSQIYYYVFHIIKRRMFLYEDSIYERIFIIFSFFLRSQTMEQKCIEEKKIKTHSKKKTFEKDHKWNWFNINAFYRHFCYFIFALDYLAIFSTHTIFSFSFFIYFLLFII